MAEARMFTDIRVRRGVLGNLKVRKLCARFGLQAMGALVGLWNHAADNAPDDGVIGHMTDEDVGFVSRYADYHPERAAEFGAALRELGFLDVLGDGRLAVHDWKEEQGFIAGATGRKARAEGTGSAGGVASRDARRAKYGTAQPPKALPNNPEQTPEQLSNNSEGPLRETRRPPSGDVRGSRTSGPDRTGPDRSYSEGPRTDLPPARVIPPMPVHGAATPLPAAPASPPSGPKPGEGSDPPAKTDRPPKTRRARAVTKLYIRRGLAVVQGKADPGPPTHEQIDALAATMPPEEDDPEYQGSVVTRGK